MEEYITVAVVSEGVTDFPILQKFVKEILRTDPEIGVFCNKTHPQDNEFAGWPKVLKFCASDTDIRAALEMNDIVIIQIDTDRSLEAFKISPPNGKAELVNIREYYNYIKNRIISYFDPDFFDIISNRIVFAICIHSIECWIFCAITQAGKPKLLNCYNKLEMELNKKDIKIEKTFACYDEISKKITRENIHFLEENGFFDFIEFKNSLRDSIKSL